MVKTYGLVLEGGGGKGGYQIGVWQALRELEIEIGAVAGTSVGALNAAFIVQDKFDAAYELWSNMSPDLVFTGDNEIYNELVSFNIKFKNWARYIEYIRNTLSNKGLDVEPLHNLITEHVDENLIRESSIDFGLVTISLTDWKPIKVYVDDIPEGEIADYLLGSSSLPVFKLDNGDDKKFLDGGFYDNLPIDMVYQLGYKDIISIELKSLGMKKAFRMKDANIISIVPSDDLGSPLDFSEQRSRNNLKLGYLDALKTFEKYEGTHYYIEDIPDDRYFIDILLDLDEEHILEMAQEINISGGSTRRVLFERLIPAFTRQANLDKEASYREIVLKFIEIFAMAAGVERLRAYTYKEFTQEILKGLDTIDFDSFDFDKIPGFLRKSLIIRPLFKKELVLNWARIILDRD